MRKLLLVIAVYFTLASNVTAQKWLVGAKAGINLPELRSPDDPGQLNKGYKSILGPHVGVTLERKFTKLFSIQTELNYSAGGAIRSGNQRFSSKPFKPFFAGSSNPMPPYLYAEFDNTVKLRYFDLPVMAKFSFPLGLKTRLSVMGGGFISYITYAHIIIKGESKIWADAEHTQELVNTTSGYIDEDIIDYTNRLNYGISGGLSISRSFLGWELSLTGSGLYGFVNLQKDTERHGKSKTGAAIVALGVARKF